MKKIHTSNSLFGNVFSGFVDVMSNLFVLMLFLLIIFIITQFFLTINLPKESKNNKKTYSETYVFFLQKNLNKTETKNKELIFKINNLNKFINELEGKIIKKENALTNEKEMNKKLEQTVKQLKEEISKLNYALEVSEELIRKNNVQIAEYSRLLNRALANKAAELHKYRSEFFENVSKVIKENKLFKVEGDRFILQSEILFPSGKAKLTNKGMSTLYSIYRELSKMYDKIPQDINWVLRVDGHTDNIPVKTTTYKSNWDLAAARAISVTEYLVSAGLPEERVIAASFGEHHPIASNKSKKGRQQNRRIEFKLTNK